MVERGVEHAPLGVAARNLDLLQLLFPGIAQHRQLFVEAVVVDVAAGLHGADIADANLYAHQRVGEGEQEGTNRPTPSPSLRGRGVYRPAIREGGSKTICSPPSIEGLGVGLLGLFCERLIRLQAEIDGVGIAVVPTTAHTTVAHHLMVADDLHLGTHKLLALAQVGDGVFAKEMGGVN